MGSAESVGPNCRQSYFVCPKKADDARVGDQREEEGTWLLSWTWACNQAIAVNASTAHPEHNSALTHTHTHLLIVYVCVCVCVGKTQGQA